MALTKVTGQVINSTTDLSVGVATVGGGTSTGDLYVVGVTTFSGDVSIGGTLTYEDVTNVDSVGLITARKGVSVTSGGLVVTGISTLNDNLIIKSTFPRLYLTDTDTNSDFSVINSNGSFMVYDDTNSASRFTINSSGVGAFNSDLEVAGSHYITDSIIHTGDTNTKIRFPAADTITAETGGSERLRINSSGALCVGTTSGPGEIGLYLGDGTNPAGHIYANGTHHMYMLANAYYSGGWKYLGNGEANSLAMQNGDFIFLNASANSSGAGQAVTWSEKFKIDSSGRVKIGNNYDATVEADNLLIGTTSGSNGLTVFSATDEAGFICFGDVNTTAVGSRSGVIRYQHSDNSMRLSTNGNNERLRIISDGKIVIGGNYANSANFGRQLLVDGTVGLNNDSGITGMGFSRGHSNTYGYIGTGSFAVNGAANDDFSISTGSTGDLLLGTAGGTERLRINNAGFVGIGEDDPQTKLNVRGTISVGRNVARELGTMINASSAYNGSRAATNLNNGNKDYDNEDDWLTASGQRTNANVTIDLGTAINCDRFVVYQQNEYANSMREVKRFTLEGSNDNSSWTSILDDEIGVSAGHSPNPGWSFRLPANYADLDEGVSYRYWKFTMKTFHGSDSYGGLMELELYEHQTATHAADEITTNSLVASDVYADTISCNRITNQGGTSGLYVDHDGTVTKPKSCAFNYNGNGNQALTSGATLTSWRSTDSRGFENTSSGGYLSSGIFTAPVTGAYFFTSTILLSGCSSNNSDFHVWWQKNGSGYHQFWNTRFPGSTSMGYGNYVPVTGSCNMYMDAGDTCRIKISYNGSNVVFYAPTGDGWSHWSGFLIG